LICVAAAGKDLSSRNLIAEIPKIVQVRCVARVGMFEVWQEMG